MLFKQHMRQYTKLYLLQVLLQHFFFFFFFVCVCMDILVKCIVVAYHVVFPTQLESTQSDN